MTQIAHPELDGIGKYEYGWSDKTDAGSNSRRGLNEEVVRDISSKKNEPQWMLDLRLKGLSLFEKKPMPSWGSDLSGIFFDTIKYFVRSTEKQATSWEDLPDDIKNTYDRLGIPEAEKKRLVAGVAAAHPSWQSPDQDRHRTTGGCNRPARPDCESRCGSSAIRAGSAPPRPVKTGYPENPVWRCERCGSLAERQMATCAQTTARFRRGCVLPVSSGFRHAGSPPCHGRRAPVTGHR